MSSSAPGASPTNISSAVRVADTKNNGMSKRNQMRTFGAGEDLRPQLFKRLPRRALSCLGGSTAVFPADINDRKVHQIGRVPEPADSRWRPTHSPFTELLDPLKYASVRPEIRALFQPAQHFDGQGSDLARTIVFLSTPLCRKSSGNPASNSNQFSVIG